MTPEIKAELAATAATHVELYDVVSEVVSERYSRESTGFVHQLSIAIMQDMERAAVALGIDFALQRLAK